MRKRKGFQKSKPEPLLPHCRHLAASRLLENLCSLVHCLGAPEMNKETLPDFLDHHAWSLYSEFRMRLSSIRSLNSLPFKTRIVEVLWEDLQHKPGSLKAALCPDETRHWLDENDLRQTTLRLIRAITDEKTFKEWYDVDPASGPGPDPGKRPLR